MKLSMLFRRNGGKGGGRWSVNTRQTDVCVNCAALAAELTTSRNPERSWGARRRTAHELRTNKRGSGSSKIKPTHLARSNRLGPPWKSNVLHLNAAEHGEGGRHGGYWHAADLVAVERRVVSNGDVVAIDGW
jgi:hypothetical protein